MLSQIIDHFSDLAARDKKAEASYFYHLFQKVRHYFFCLFSFFRPKVDGHDLALPHDLFPRERKGARLDSKHKQFVSFSFFFSLLFWVLPLPSPFFLADKGYTSKCPLKVECILVSNLHKWLKGTTKDCSTMRDILFSSAANLAVMHEIMKQSFTLPYSNNLLVLASIEIYQNWLTDVVSLVVWIVFLLRRSNASLFLFLFFSSFSFLLLLGGFH